MAKEQTFLKINEGRRKREELTLPILHFSTADALPNTESWIDTLKPKAFCAWLQFHTIVNRTNQAMEENGNRNTVPRSIEDLIKNIFKVSKSTFYNTILKPLWNYGLIDIVEWKGDTKIGQKAMNIIVYHYPQNNKSFETKPLEKVRDYDKDYKSNGKIYGDLGGKKRKGSQQEQNKSITLVYKSLDLSNRIKNCTVIRTNVLLENIDTANRIKNCTVTVQKIRPINNSNPMFNISKRDIKQDTYKDTEQPDLSTNNNVDNEFRKEQQEKIYKKTLEDKMPEQLFNTLNVLSEDYNEMYKWYGILLRAKADVEKKRDTLIPFEIEDITTEINKALQSGIRAIKKEQKTNPDNYLYTTIKNKCNDLYKVKKSNQYDKMQSAFYTYLNDDKHSFK